MKKGVEIAFAIVLVILSILGTIWPTELMISIIYSVVIPSFVLSLISFVAEISLGCEEKAKEQAEAAKEVADLTNELADLKLELYQAGKYDVPYRPEYVPKEIHEKRQECLGHLNTALASADARLVFQKCKRICDRIMVAGYVILFLSLCFSPYIVKWLSAIDLNCITLWSLALLYLSLELKEEVCGWLFERLFKKYEKRAKEEIGHLEEDDAEGEA